MSKFKLTDNPHDLRIALNVIGDSVAALVLIPIVNVAFGFAEVPVRVLAFGIIMLAVGALLYYVVDRQIPAPERPVIETEEADELLGETATNVKVPKMPNYPPKNAPESAILYRHTRRAIVLTPYVLLAVTAIGLTILLLTGGMSIEGVNGTLLFLEIVSVLLILFDRRHDVLGKERVYTTLLCLIYVAAIIFVWTSQQQISVYFGQLAIVTVTVALKVWLWTRTWIVATKKVMLYMIMTPFGNIAPSIEIRAASAPNITQSLLDILLNTCTIHLDTSADENGRFRSLHFVKFADEVRPLFGQPTSAELKKNARDEKLRNKALKAKRKEMRRAKRAN